MNSMHLLYFLLPFMTYQYQLIDLILLSSFLRLLAMLILLQQENEHGGVHILLQDTYSESSQIYHLAIMYCFEHTNHGFRRNFLFQNLCKLIVCVCVYVICIGNIFHV